jgi:hypothetical protein
MQSEFEDSAFPSTTGTSSLVPTEILQVTSDTRAPNPIFCPPLDISDISGQRMTPKVDQLLAWPVVQELLQCDSLNLSHWGGGSQSAESWLIDVSQEFDAVLPVDGPTRIYYSDNAILDLHTARSMTLNRSYIKAQCAIYFKTYHCTYPILDRSHFYSSLLPQVCKQSFNETYSGSTLVLLVLALGTLAQEGATGAPIADETGRQTGIRGGSPKRPPGLVFLNEAKRRFGVALTDWNTDNLLCYILCA